MPSSNTRICPACAMVMPASFPAGLCPKCLLVVASTPAGAPPEDLEAAERTIPVAPPVSGSTPVRPTGVPSLELLRKLFPELEILDVLGAGGMGAVYKARQPRLNRLIALKIMVAAPGHEADFALRFEREAQVLARLSHPHIVILYDFGELSPERTRADPLFYFLMEFVDGTDLGQLIKSKELKPSLALTIVPQICEALQYAHDQGITHRDIKPANILIDKKGTVKIADFGLAKMVGGDAADALMTGLTQTGTAMGTPHYMAPEQWEHPELVDHRADIYALGVVFYEMLTGERPAGVFEPPSRKTSPPVDKKLDGVVMRAMDKNPDRRYQQAGQIGDDVTRISGANKRKPATTGAAAPKRSPLKPLLALGVAAVLAVGGWMLWQGGAGSPPVAVPPETALPGPSALPQAPALPAHEWVKVDWPGQSIISRGGSRPVTQEDIPKEGGLRLLKDDLWISHQVPRIGKMQNGGIRLRWKRLAEKTGNLDVHLRGGANPKVSLWGNAAAVFHGGPTAEFQLQSTPHGGKAPVGREVFMEIACVGRLLIVKRDGIVTGTQELPQAAPADYLRFQGSEVIVTQAELINLDHLSEADALKVLGVDSAVPAIAPAPPRAAWMPMYRQAADLAPLFGKPQSLYIDFQSHAALVQDPASGLKLTGGWLTPTTTQVKLPLPSARNAGVRLKVKMSDPDKMDGASIWLRSVDGGAVYSGGWRGIIHNFGKSPKEPEYLAARTNLVAKKLGETFTLEFYAIGTHLICRYEGDVLRISEPGANRAPGTVNHLMIRNPVTDIEVINLDGLSEAEALKLAGVGETQPSAFPAGQWTKVLTTQAEVDAIVGLKGKVTVQPDGWLDFSVPKDAPGVGLAAFSAANAGVRVKLRIADKALIPVIATLTLRHTTAPPPRQEGYRLQLGGGDTANPSVSLAHYDGLTRKSNVMKKQVRTSALQAGDEMILEFYTIGSRLIGRVNGELLPIAEDQRLTRGVLTLHTGHLLRDIEVINLDGLSEAEALKPAGVNSAVPSPTALEGPSALPSAKPGRLRASGTTASGKSHDLTKFAAHDDFVEVAGGWSRWVALRANGQTVSSDGKADFKDIARIAASFNSEYAFITKAGKLVIPDYEKWTLPSSLEQGVVDAALGIQHGIALREGGKAVVFGARYDGTVGDPSDPKQYGTPRWPAPEVRALEKVKAVAATVTHAATLHENGSLSLWGWEGPLKWQADPRQKPLRQLRSTEDGFWALDEAGQLWHLPVPRNPAPGQPVYVTDKPSPSESGVTHLGPRCWRRKSGEWIASMNTNEGMDLMKAAGISESTAFYLDGGTFDGKPFASLLWIEPVASGSAAGPPAAAVPPQTALGGPSALPPFTDREAAEWVLGLEYDACNVKVQMLKGGKFIEVRKLADLPAEPFVIHDLRVNLSPKEQAELWAKVTDAVVLRLAGLRSLKLAAIRGNVTGASLKVMAHHPGLERLDFEGLNLRADDLRHLRASPLQTLEIPLLQVTDPESLAVLTTMPNLLTLQFDGSLDPALAAALPNLPELEILRANNSANTTDEVLPLLAERLPQLSVLQHWGAKNLKGSTLGSLMALKSLTTLGLTDTSVNDEGLAQIAGMPQLLTLDLGQTRITDACLPTLKSLPKLESLQIYQTELTDAALLELASIPTLKRLGTKASGYSDWKPGVTFTEAGIAAFEKLRPDVEVVK